MKLDQESYVQTILKNFNMEDAKTAATPMIDHQNNENQVRSKRSFPYREAVGSLLYLSNKTRPDIAYSVINSYSSRKKRKSTKHRYQQRKKDHAILDINKE